MVEQPPVLTESRNCDVPAIYLSPGQERLARLQGLAASAEPSELVQWTQRLKTGAMISIAVLILGLANRTLVWGVLAAFNPYNVAIFFISIGSLIAGWLLISPEPNATRFIKQFVWVTRAGLCVGLALTAAKTVEAIAGVSILIGGQIEQIATTALVCAGSWQLRRFGAMLGDAVIRRTHGFLFWLSLIALPFLILQPILTPAPNTPETAAPAELPPFSFAYMAIPLAFGALFVWADLRLWRRADELEKLSAARAA